jgi:hypothetical protein
MSEQTPDPNDLDREHSGGDPHHDPTQPAPESDDQARREQGDDDQDSDD